MNFEKEMSLTSGPTREELFDCARLGPWHEQQRVVEFWGRENLPNGGSSGSAINVEIEGLHRAGDSGREWFFWGAWRMIGGGKPRHEGKRIGFVFGRWNTYHRRGKIRFGKTSFFVSPLSPGLHVEETEVIGEWRDDNQNSGRLGIDEVVICAEDVITKKGVYCLKILHIKMLHEGEYVKAFMPTIRHLHNSGGVNDSGVIENGDAYPLEEAQAYARAVAAGERILNTRVALL